MIEIRTANSRDIDELRTLPSDGISAKEEGYFERCLDEQNLNFREVFVMLENGRIAGYCHYQRRPGYQPFRSLGIAEIQDLYIVPGARQKGLATLLVERCIEQAREEGKDIIGIGVGLSSNYGKAQRLYVKLGFEPDGAGAVYERRAVTPDQLYRIDDELCLMMIRRL